LGLVLKSRSKIRALHVGEKVRVSFKGGTCRCLCQSARTEDGIVESSNYDSTFNIWFPENDDPKTKRKHSILSRKKKSVSRILQSRITAMRFREYNELTAKGEMIIFRTYASEAGDTERMFYGEIKSVDYHDFSYLVLPLWEGIYIEDFDDIKWKLLPRTKKNQLIHIIDENVVSYNGRWRLLENVNASCQTVYWKPGIHAYRSETRQILDIHDGNGLHFGDVTSLLSGRHSTRKNSINLILSITSKLGQLSHLRKSKNKLKRNMPPKKKGKMDVIQKKPEESFDMKKDGNTKYHSSKKRKAKKLRRTKSSMSAALVRNNNTNNNRQRGGDRGFDMNASNASRWLKKEVKKKEEIHNILKDTVVVKTMRENYARNMFYTWVLYYLLNFIAFLMCGLFFFRLGYNNYLYGMKETIENELRGESFDSIANLQDIYAWLEEGLINTSLPTLNASYQLVGPIVLQQERSYPKKKNVSLIGEITNATKTEKDIFFYDDLSYLIPMNHSAFQPWGLPSTNDANGTKKPFGNPDLINQDVTDSKFTIFLNKQSRHLQVRQLRKRQYLDKWTSQIRVRLVLHSANIDGYCLIRIDFDRYPSNRLRKKMEYQVFSLENADNDFVIYMKHSTIFYYAWFFFVWYFTIFILSETITLFSEYHMSFVRDNVLYYAYEEWRRSDGMMKYHRLKRERKSKLATGSQDFLFKSFYKLLQMLSKMKLGASFIYKMFETIFNNLTFGKLFYVLVHLSIVWTYVSYYQARGEFFEYYHKANGGTLDYLTDDKKLLATKSYLESLLRVKTVLMNLRAIYVYWGLVTLLNIHKQLYMHPKAGQFFLGIYHTFTSYQVILFLAILLTEYGLLTCFYMVMYGDIKEEFSTPLNSFVNTLIFALLGEIDIDTIFPIDTSEAPLFLQFFFLIVVLFPTIMMLTNLFIAIIVAIWDRQNKKKLWNDFLDEKLRLHLKCEFANEFYVSNYIVRLMLWADRVFSSHHLKCGKRGKIVGYTDTTKTSYVCCCCIKSKMKGSEEWRWETLHDDEDDHDERRSF